jgi:hypothetical protein
MMMIRFILLLLFLHWVTDFFLQSDAMALQKSENNKVLGKHCLIYSFPLSLLFLFWGLETAGIAFGALFISHFAIDYVTARLNKKFWLNNKRHEFFVMIGFDQFLHYMVLLLLVLYLWK